MFTLFLSFFLTLFIYLFCFLFDLCSFHSFFLFKIFLLSLLLSFFLSFFRSPFDVFSSPSFFLSFFFFFDFVPSFSLSLFLQFTELNRTHTYFLLVSSENRTKDISPYFPSFFLFFFFRLNQIRNFSCFYLNSKTHKHPNSTALKISFLSLPFL